MGGTEFVYNLFAECRPGSNNDHSGLCVIDPGSFASIWPVIRAVGVAMIVKGALTVITFGIKVPAGIFIPSLGVGACAGRILGLLMQHFQYNHPDSVMFAPCKGDLRCKWILETSLLKEAILMLSDRYRTWIVRYGWCGSYVIGSHCTCQTAFHCCS
jgi:hypothetical protein